MKKLLSHTIILGAAITGFALGYASTPLSADQIKSIQSPFSYNVGINFDTMAAPSVNNLSSAEELMKNVSTNIKLFRVYRLCAVGSADCSVIDIPTKALAKQMQEDSSIEAVIGTLNVMPISANDWVKKLKQTFGNSVNQIKAILIGNEVNANNISASELKARIQAISQALTANGLPNISVSASFNGLPRIGNDPNANAIFDPYMSAVVDSWKSTWNHGHPFVEFDPYADALVSQKTPQNIINAVPKVFSEYYADVYHNYISRFKTSSGKPLQAFIGETGAEGIEDKDASYAVKVNNAITSSLTNQHSMASGYTIPTFLFEMVNEPNKADGQRQMGFFNNDGQSNGSNIPNWVSDKK